MQKTLLLLSAAGCLALLGQPTALAHDGFWTGGISTTGSAGLVSLTHEDAAPWKGNIHLTVTNTGAEPWGDFHFQIFDPIGGQDLSNVHFLDSSTIPVGPDPTSSQSSLSWTINNVVVGATIDLFFYGDPVLPGETANFAVFTDNPDHVSFFGVGFYPTPIPEPASLTLLALAGLLIRRRG